MNKIVDEWIKKAEGDYVSVLREYRARKHPNYDASGFHAQQCIEKYMKPVPFQLNIFSLLCPPTQTSTPLKLRLRSNFDSAQFDTIRAKDVTLSLLLFRLVGIIYHGNDINASKFSAFAEYLSPCVPRG